MELAGQAGSQGQQRQLPARGSSSPLAIPFCALQPDQPALTRPRGPTSDWGRGGQHWDVWRRSHGPRGAGAHAAAGKALDPLARCCPYSSLLAVMEGARVLLNASASEAEELLSQLPPPRPGRGPASLQDSAGEHPFSRDDLYSPHDALMDPAEERSPKSYLAAHGPELDLPAPRKAAGLWAPPGRSAGAGGVGGGMAGFRAASLAATDRTTSAGWVFQGCAGTCWCVERGMLQWRRNEVEEAQRRRLRPACRGTAAAAAVPLTTVSFPLPLPLPFHSQRPGHLWCPASVRARGVRQPTGVCTGWPHRRALHAGGGAAAGHRSGGGLDALP